MGIGESVKFIGHSYPFPTRYSYRDRVLTIFRIGDSSSYITIEASECLPTMCCNSPLLPAACGPPLR